MLNLGLTYRATMFSSLWDRHQAYKKKIAFKINLADFPSATMVEGRMSGRCKIAGSIPRLLIKRVDVPLSITPSPGVCVGVSEGVFEWMFLAQAM